MAKEQIKINAINAGRYIVNDGGALKIENGEPILVRGDVVIPLTFSDLDVHRPKHRAKGGTYTDENAVVLFAPEHMREHDNWRERLVEFDEVKTLVDHRNQLLKLTNKVNNQLLAFQRNVDRANAATVKMLEDEAARYRELEMDSRKDIAKAVKRLAKVDPLVKSALGVKGLAELTIASLIVYIDLEKARHPSSLWAYCGYDSPSHSRYEKNKAGGGNKTLRCALFNFGDSQIKSRGAYRDVYDNVKARLEVSQKMTKTRKAGRTGVVEMKWCEVSAGHRHGAAMRAMAKHLLADYWFVGRTLAGLETNPTYAEAQLGMSHKTINPAERGWVF